uniref:HYPK_UBA domain-containing protein n=1 Tax=Strongyloides stercoralis TaxID=6248 RepID=A0A0K0DSN5_STRER
MPGKDRKKNDQKNSDEPPVPKYNLGTEDLKKVADYFATEDENIGGLNESFAKLTFNKQEVKKVPVKLNKEHIQVLMNGFEMSRVNVEKRLQKFEGDPIKAALSFVGY